jgi:hypothetical protein
MKVLALDLATRTGFAYGDVGVEAPACGSVQLARPGSSHGAIASGFISWLAPLLAKEKPNVVVYEAPLPPFVKIGKRNANADRILTGLCFLAEGIAHCRGIFDVREARAVDVRRYFLDNVQMSHGFAKQWVVRKCRSLGWLESADDDAADACATWDYMCALIDPRIGVKRAPLFLLPKVRA